MAKTHSGGSGPYRTGSGPYWTGSDFLKNQIQTLHNGKNRKIYRNILHCQHLICKYESYVPYCSIFSKIVHLMRAEIGTAYERKQNLFDPAQPGDTVV